MAKSKKQPTVKEIEGQVLALIDNSGLSDEDKTTLYANLLDTLDARHDDLTANAEMEDDEGDEDELDDDEEDYGEDYGEDDDEPEDDSDDSDESDEDDF